MYIWVFSNLCMKACMSVCKYACIYVRMCACICINAFLNVCMYVHVSGIYVACMCMYACTYLWMHVCLYVYVFNLNIYMWICFCVNRVWQCERLIWQKCMTTHFQWDMISTRFLHALQIDQSTCLLLTIMAFFYGFLHVKYCVCHYLCTHSFQLCMHTI